MVGATDADMEFEMAVTVDESELENLEQRELEQDVDIELDDDTSFDLESSDDSGFFAGGGRGGMGKLAGILTLLGAIISILAPLLQLVQLIFRALTLTILPVIKMLGVVLREPLQRLIEAQAKANNALSNIEDFNEQVQDDPRGFALHMAEMATDPTGMVAEQLGLPTFSSIQGDAMERAFGERNFVDAGLSMVDILGQGHVDDMSDEAQKEIEGSALEKLWRMVEP